MLEPLPNIHPILVHFPIALLTLSVLFDGVAVSRRAPRWTRTVATALLTTGAVLLIPTYLAGRQAADQVASPLARTQSVLSDHADWAWYTLWFFLALATGRLLLMLRGALRRSTHAAALLLGMGGLYLLLQTGEHGGRLVYGLGVGVRPVIEAMKQEDPPEPPGRASIDAAPGPTVAEDGTFAWAFEEGSEIAFDRHFSWLSGTPIVPSLESRRTALLFSSDDPLRRIVVLHGRFGDLQLEVHLNADRFDGTVGLVHHVQSAGHYDSMTFDRAVIRLGRTEDGSDRVARSKALAETGGWHRYRLVSSGRHIRAYRDGVLVLHVHHTPLPPGKVGLLVQGTGTLRLASLRVAPLGRR
ncbi:MAG: DUF2231 domain-containing protein [Acidobacteriota bacterium]